MSPPLSVAPTPGEPPSGAFDFSGEEQAKTKGMSTARRFISLLSFREARGTHSGYDKASH
jgi:hypothetical protein